METWVGNGGGVVGQGSHSLGTLIEWKLIWAYEVMPYILFPLAGDIN